MLRNLNFDQTKCVSWYLTGLKFKNKTVVLCLSKGSRYSLFISKKLTAETHTRCQLMSSIRDNGCSLVPVVRGFIVLQMYLTLEVYRIRG